MKVPPLLLKSPPLFWRTFLLIVLLSAASLAAWLPSVRMFEREPRAHRIAQQVASIVNTTRSALVYSDPERRRGLLLDLAANEGIRVVPLEPTDQAKALPDTALAEMVGQQVKQRLGPATRLAAEVNGVKGIWVSFEIDDDAYWVFIDRDLFSRAIGREWLAWAAISALLSLAVAVAIARVVNRPLAALSRAAGELGAGRTPALLPDRGPPEIRTVNRNFNRMVSGLEQLERDRSTLLAGISHDLRTPLTRLHLELEMLEMPAATRAALAGDLEQMNAILGQFLDYARSAPPRDREPFDLAELVSDTVRRSRLTEAEATRVEERAQPGLMLNGCRTELVRALDNLLSNADRYGRDGSGALKLLIEMRRDGDEILLAVADQGPGIDAAQTDRLLRPFERGDTSRTGAAGAGLGLAIVDRIVRQHGGRLSLAPNAVAGLRVELRLPAAASTIGE